METAMSAITTKEASADAKVATMSVESSGTVANQDDARPVATMVGAHDESSLELELKLHQSEAEALEAESSRLQNEIHELEQKLAQLKNDQTRNQTALVEKRKWIELNEWYLWLSRADETDNAPKKRHVEDESMLPMGYVHSLGTTLLGLGQNSNDATGARTPFSIPLVLRLLLPASCVPFDHVDFEAQASEHLKPLLQHVATSSTLRRIVMSEKPRSWCRDRDTFQAVNDFLVTSFLDAMSCNPIIDTVEFSCPVPASTFSRYAMATSSTLKRLVMDLEPLRDTPVEDLKSLVVAFQAMNALESLTMLEFDGGLLNCFVIPSLESIRIGCFALHELKLRAGSRFRKNSLLWNQLAKVCHSARHGRLQHLELHGFHFEKSDLEDLVKCLKCPVDNHGDVQSLPVLGIAKLSIPNCRICEDGWPVLVTFLQTTSRHSSALRELHGVELYNEYNLNSYENQRSITSLLGAFEVANRGVNRGRSSSTIHMGIDSIGSHLHALSVECFDERSRADLMRLFSTQSSAATGLIQLQCLSITKMRSYHCAWLRDCLVNAVLPSLRQLHLSEVSPGSKNYSSSEYLVDMMRRNGNICILTATTDENDKALFSPSQQRRVDAYCQRNAFLLNLANNKQDDPNDTESAGNRLDPSQYAMLLRVARQVSKEKMKGVVWRLD